MTNLPAFLVTYDVMSLASALIFSLMILTAVLSKHVSRGKGWFSMMSYWLVYAVSYGLLVGKQLGPEPTFDHCFAQTMLIYAAPPLVAVGTLCFYLDFYLGSRFRRRSLRPGIAYLILAFPWLVHLIIDIEVIILALTSSSDPVVQRNRSTLYCSMTDDFRPGLVNAAIVILSMILLIPFEVWMGVRLYRSRKTQTGEDYRQYLAAYLRIAACTIVSAGAFSLSAITLTKTYSNNKVRDISFPLLSMLVAIIFATQQDLLDVWFRHPFKYFFPNRSIAHPMDHPQVEELKGHHNRATIQSEL